MKKTAQMPTQHVSMAVAIRLARLAQLAATVDALDAAGWCCLCRSSL